MRKYLMVFVLAFSIIHLCPVVTTAQDVTKKEIVLEVKKERLPQVFKRLEKITNYKIMFVTEDVNKYEVSGIIRAKDIHDAMKQIIGEKPLEYTVDKQFITVTLKKAAIPKTAENLIQQTTFRKIVGRVTDSDGNTLPGVSVMQKGTSIGTTTDINGDFGLRLSAVSGEGPTYLVFSFIGMETQEVMYREDKPLNVVMKDAYVPLGEVIIDGGYQKLPRKDMVGAFTTVNAEDVIQNSYSSIDQMLQGRIAGLVSVNTSSRVGRAPQIRIRGVSTLLGNKDPLWVVDGIIQPDPLPFDASSALTADLAQMVSSQVAWLHPADIETITVLKDASATAVYGSKASNGVIVITTKRGKADHLSVHYSLSMGIRARPNYDQFDLMNSQERIRFSKEAYDVGARYQTEPYPQTSTYEGLMHMLGSNMITEAEYSKQVAHLETVNTDWLKLLTRNSFNHNHNLSISGGSQKSTYNASFSYSNNKGIEIGNDIDQLNIRLGFNSKVTERLRIDMSMNGSIGNSHGFNSVNPLSYATTTSRSLPAYEQNGEYLYYKKLYGYKYNADQVPLGNNILNERDHSRADMKNNRFDASLNINYKVFSFLDYQVVGGISSASSNSRSFSGEQTRHIAQNYRGYDYGSEEVNSKKYKAAILPFGGELFTSESKSVNFNMQHKLVFSKTFNTNHRLNAMAAGEIRSTKVNFESNTVWGFVPERGEKIMRPTPINQLEPINVAFSKDNWGVLDALYNGAWSTTERTDNFLSFFATLAYSFRDRYVVNANIRNDVSNRFGQDVNKRIDPTYSFGASWRIAEEPFIKENISWLEQLNFRGTFGIQGNVVNTISPDLILSQQGVYSNYNEYYTTIGSLPNPLLKWERTKTWNLGLDIQPIRGISMTLDYYGRRSNAIVSQDVPQEYGVSRMRLNGGMIKNHGIEYSINFIPYKRDNFVWTLGLNASKNWNKVDSEDASVGATTTNKSHYLGGATDRMLKKGYPIGGFWSYSFAGLEADTGYPMFNHMDFDKVNPDVDPTTFLVYSGQQEPYFTGGLNTSIRWHSLSLSTNFSLLLGGKKRLSNPYGSFSNGKIPNPDVNFSRQLNDRWKKPGDEAHTNIPALWTAVLRNFNQTTPDGLPESIYTMWGSSDDMVVNASFLRCNQISLGWSMNPNICSKLGVKSLSVNASTNNVFVIASKRFNGFDPELNGRSVMPRMFSIGFNVGF